ncbi:MAG: tRNA dihydrouridine synthase DusB [Blastochloris sp.]|nr:tRNA dihydrouridine synthase DusB [Blastochloris sp.]
MRDAARFLEDLGVDLIDINMGCPVDRITKGGAGAALMLDEELTEELVLAIVEAVEIPVTVKMRLGWDEDTINAHVLAPRLEQMGVAAVAVHGRTKQQAYTGSVNLEAIRAVVQSVKKIPVIGNGDVHTHHDAKRMLEEVGCSAVMVGRAALSDPFFFCQTSSYLRTGREPVEIGLAARLLFMHYHFSLALRYFGEEEACLLFRKVISGYSEFFGKKERWRVAMNCLESVQEYLDVVSELTPDQFPPEIRNPKLCPESLYVHLRSSSGNLLPASAVI